MRAFSTVPCEAGLLREGGIHREQGKDRKRQHVPGSETQTFPGNLGSFVVRLRLKSRRIMTQNISPFVEMPECFVEMEEVSFCVCNS